MLKMNCRALRILTVFFVAAAIPAAVRGEGAAGEKPDGELEALLERVDEANSELISVKADVSYTRTIVLLDESDSAAGTLAFKTPDMIHMALGEPRNEEVYSDGSTWWLVDHDARQVEIYEAAEGDAVAEASFLEFGYGSRTSSLRENYSIELVAVESAEAEGDEEPGTVTMWRLRLEPLKDERPARFERMDVEITENLYLPETIILYESGGEIVQRFELKNIRMNEDIDDSRFVCDIPRRYRTVRP